MQPKGMEDLAAFSARGVKRAAAEERNEYFSAEGQWESINVIAHQEEKNKETKTGERREKKKTGDRF